MNRIECAFEYPLYDFIFVIQLKYMAHQPAVKRAKVFGMCAIVSLRTMKHDVSYGSRKDAMIDRTPLDICTGEHFQHSIWMLSLP
ncbi:MAG TPA: hypothetical protein DDW73_07890 [Rhizobium sp.]|nr:hypothetical protein [Rhizobium sp.]